MEPKYSKWFTDEFNTKLSPENETRFQVWLSNTQSKYGVDLAPDLSTYDLRGFWVNGGYKDEAFRKREGHAPDTFKKPSHPTFSNESIYHNTPSVFGGNWQGGAWRSETEFEPSEHMLRHTHPPDWYKKYMQENGEGVKLIFGKRGPKTGG